MKKFILINENIIINTYTLPDDIPRPDDGYIEINFLSPCELYDDYRQYKPDGMPYTEEEILDFLGITEIPAGQVIMFHDGAWVLGDSLYGIMTLDEVKAVKTASIRSAFHDNLRNGTFQSVALGILVDARRSDVNNDLQNVEGLIAIMQSMNIPSVEYVGRTEKAPATVEQLVALTGEMKVFVFNLYQRKWALEAAIQSATSIDDLKAIDWSVG